ncbi:MAG: dockerin type I domain-containing protein [Candidatus Poribacteria bacterium]|nr:dockerin type I domain-containing protein [Candidatus Poribacteria bacterium]
MHLKVRQLFSAVLLLSLSPLFLRDTWSQPYPLRATLRGHTTGITALTFTPDSATIVSAGWDAIYLWDVNTGQPKTTLSGKTDYFVGIAVSPDGSTIAAGSDEATIWMWDLHTGQHKTVLRGHRDPVEGLAFSPDGRILASASHDGTIRFWDPNTGEHQLTLHGHSSGVISLRFSPDGRTLASGSWDSTIRLWDTETGETKTTLRGHSKAVEAVVFSPDGRTFASASRDNTIRLWGVTEGVTKAILRGHSNTVEALAFSPDGYMLASGSWDNTIRLWNVSTGHHLTTLQGHSGDIEALAFSKNGHLLASGSADETIRLWAVTPLKHEAALEVVEDINLDGKVDVMDLVLVASDFGKTFVQGEQLNADVNNDGIVDRRDVMQVLDALEVAAAPSTRAQRVPTLLAQNLQFWINRAKELKSNHESLQDGIAVLNQLRETLIQTQKGPTETILLTNYPNPFNPETWIPYRLAEAAAVRVQIYTPEGLLIRRLILGHQPIGTYESRNRAAYWDGRNQQGEQAASGIYFYTLEAGDFTATRKMLIRK